MKIAIDAMGGDTAPRAIVEGAVLAARNDRADLVLVGDQARVEAELSTFGVRPPSLSVLHASETIGMGESPLTAVKTKKDSSLVVTARQVKDGAAGAAMSMGNTGACMAAALFALGRLEG